MSSSTQPTPATASAPNPCGVIYLASGGRNYLGELLTSLESLRRWEPDLPVTVFSPFRLPKNALCSWVHYESAEHPLKQKVMVLRQSPYERTLFLDTDTVVRRPIQDVFAKLDHSDLAVANMFEADWSCHPPRLLNLTLPGDFNTGVLVFKKTRAVLAFLDAWEKAVRSQDPRDMWAGHNCDQDYFNKLVRAGALDECGVRFLTLANTEWNVRGIMVAEMKRLNRWHEARILHHRTKAMKWRKALHALTDFDVAWEICRKTWRKLRLRKSQPTLPTTASLRQ